MESNFLKFDDTVATTLNTSYDYASVMHYETRAFSINGNATIIALRPNTKIGQRYKLSATDIQEIRTFYNCSSIGPTLPQVTTPTTPSKKLTAKRITKTLFIHTQNPLDFIIVFSL